VLRPGWQIGAVVVGRFCGACQRGGPYNLGRETPEAAPVAGI
jgi:hypothetical protein